ncbi:tandem large repeat [Vibrio sp. T11.5]|uniref:tandem large repeat n=1 Tax=Vibrio sp. T11.5 TaxID=2998836 RepID=UPI0022CD7CB8|nr:tandem large repeat [Vibrio sp. T11.5]MDA0117644.1 tandem large repeat [Vibrio sp. T11.5]
MRYKYIIKLFLTIFTILLLSSCGGGGGGDSSPRSREHATISGIVFDAPVSQALVTVYEYQSGKVGRKLGTSTTNSTGAYSIEVDASSMPLYIVAEGGGYLDPLTNKVIRVSENKSIKMTSVINYVEGSNQAVMITPLTYLVSGLAEFNISRGKKAATAIDEALETINNMYGFNVNSVKPIDITTGGHNTTATDGHKYGALLTAYSSYSFDYINEDGTGSSVYTSMNLADLGYRDIAADGMLNGYELDDQGAFPQKLNFGAHELSSDFYTNSMAEHVLIVVSNPALNISKTPVSDYMKLAENLNSLGTNDSDEGAIPSREWIDIDKDAPTAKREGDSVLTGTESIEVVLKDKVGVQSAKSQLKYHLESGEWLEASCDASYSREAELCWTDKSDFVEGPRETRLKVYVNTEVLDSLGVESRVTEAHLLVKTADVLENQNDVGVEVPFEWDNVAPVIEVTSSETINASATTYILTGIVKEHPDSLKQKSAFVSLSGGEAIPNTCEPINSGDNVWCKFTTNAYDTRSFGDSANFTITAEDIHGNQGKSVFTLYKDSVPPILTLSFPNEEFNYENQNGDNLVDKYTDTTYTESSVDTATKYLKIDYKFAADGLDATVSGLDFTQFSEQTLLDHSVPYVTATIMDSSEGGSYSSSADDLTFKVTYYRKKSDSGSYLQYGQTTQIASDAVSEENKGIPFEELNFGTDEKVIEMKYYIPFVKEVLDTSFVNATSSDSQKLVLSAIDPSGNESISHEVYFKTTFDKPEVTIVSPFIDAPVRLLGLNESRGDFNTLGTCRTKAVNGANDEASCTIAYESKNYHFFKVSLGSDDPTHYFQWSLDTQTDVNILPTENIGAYFSGADKTTLYITEFSSYHTGLFDSQWDNLTSGEKTLENAERILAEVKDALATQDHSMLGFDPISTKYATNKMLESSVPDPLTDPFIYRFLLESLTQMAEDNSAANSSTVEYASAFYQDLEHDGLANGIGESGQITIGHYSLSSDSYREELAQGYYDVAHDLHGVESKEALDQADHFATANPTFGGGNIFSDQGGSIDQQAPTVSVVPNHEQAHGSFTQVGNDTDYNIAGSVQSEVTIEDIATVNEEKTVLSAYWVDGSKKKTLAEIEFVLNRDKSTDYKKVYAFTIDSLDPEFVDAEHFEIIAKVEDGIGNGQGPYVASTYYVDNEPPIGSLTTLTPEHPTEADSVTVTLQFDKPVTSVAATFSDIDIDFGESQEYKLSWTGTTSDVVSLNPDENSKPLVVSRYHDELNNAGEAFSEDIIITPTITIDNVTDDNVVDSTVDDVKNISFSGSTKGFLRDSQLSVNVVSEKRPNIDKFELTGITVNQDGTWATSNQDMSTWEESSFTIEVIGRNSEESQYVAQEKDSSYVDSIAPQVLQSQISMSGSATRLLTTASEEMLVDGEIATVTLAFSERVRQPEVVLNGQAITFNQPDEGVSKIWVGTSPALILPSNVSTSKLVVSNYQDTASTPNLGARYEKTLDVKPIILMPEILDLSTSEARAFVVSGTARGFENGAQLSVSVSNNSPLGETFSGTVTVSGGAWKTAPEDISSWESGTLTITVNGSNSGGHAATLVSQDVALEDDIAPDVSRITVNSGVPIEDNRVVSVNLTFSERVKNVVANVDGVDVNFTSQGNESTIWEGVTSDVVIVNANEMFKTVTVTQYQDVQGNHGTSSSSEVPVKPVIEMTPRGGPIDEEESSQVVISGFARGFKAGDQVSVVASLDSDPSTYHFSETVDVSENGGWSTSEQNIRNWPSGDINLTVTGHNQNGQVAETAPSTIDYADVTPPGIMGEIAFDPEAPEDGQSVTITVNFTELVTGVTANVGGVAVAFSGHTPAKQWVGSTETPITLSSNEDTIVARVNAGYEDLSGNTAVDFKETATGVKPVLYLEPVEGNNEINSQEAEHVVIHGTGVGFSGDTEMITVTVTSQENTAFHWQQTVPISEAGSWTTEPHGHNMSDWPLGLVSVEVTGTNQQGGAADPVREDSVYIVASVTGVESLSPSEPEHNNAVSVTVNFDNPVKGLSGSFAGVPMTFTKVTLDSELSEQWTGQTNREIALTAGRATEALVLNNFENSSGNSAGQVYEEAFFVKPLIEIDSVNGENVIDSGEVSEFYITGQSKGMENNGTLRVKVNRSFLSSTKHDEVVTVESDGTWSTGNINATSWWTGDYVVQVTGVNSGNVSADEATQTFIVQ